MNKLLSKAAVLILLLASPAMGQFDAAEVLGTVRDGTGSVLVQAEVTLLNESTGLSATTLTDASGNYNFFNVRPGLYKLTGRSRGSGPFPPGR